MGMRAWVAVLVLGLASAGCVGRVIESRPTPGVPSGVPEVYRAAYGEIAAELDRQLPFMSLPWGGKRTATAFGVELLAANSNRGPELLHEHVMAGVGLTLDRLTELGVRCVAFSLHYPVLTRGYPRSADYREFYRRVAAEVRRRGLAIVAEMGSAFAEPELGRLGGVRGVKRDALNAGLREMAEAIVADIRPDFFTVLTEPDTLARNTGLTFTPTELARTVTHVVRGLPHDGVRLGAGAGTWSAHDYFKELALLPELDYLDLRINPVQHGFASDRALKAAEAARARGKGVSIGAAWLYKASGREWRTVPAVEVLSRDAFAFWQPLDQDFIRLVVELARRIDAEFCVFFGMKYLYAYLPLTPETERMSPGERMRASDRAAAENIQAGRLSPTGERFRSLIAP